MSEFYPIVALGILIAAGAWLHYVIGKWCEANRLRKYIAKRPPRTSLPEDLPPIEWVSPVQVEESSMNEFNAAQPRSEKP